MTFIRHKLVCWIQSQGLFEWSNDKGVDIYRYNTTLITDETDLMF